jgi:hypothetical protein
MRKRIAVSLAGALLVLSAFGGIALADDGSVMSRLMGHDAYARMVAQMRAFIGDERTDAMLAHCEQAMTESATPGTDMGAMMRGMGGMMGSGR